MSYGSYPPQAPLTEYTPQNTHVYLQHPPPQYLEATYYIQVYPYPFRECSQVLPKVGSGIIGGQQPGLSPGPRIAMDTFYLQPQGISRSHFLDYSSPGLESLGLSPSPAHLTPMQPNFSPVFASYFLSFDQNCQYIQQRRPETHFTELKYPQNCHTFCNPEPLYPTRSGDTNVVTTWWMGDQYFTAARVFSPPALPIWGGNTDSFIGDPNPMRTHSIGNSRWPYGFNPPPPDRLVHSRSRYQNQQY